MSLPPGDKLGPYEILSSIGTGGKGEVGMRVVYIARDLKLDPSVRAQNN